MKAAHRSPLRVVELFAGAGGMSLGWKMALPLGAVEIVAAVDSDASLERLYCHNFPTTRLLCFTFPERDWRRGAACAAGLLELQTGDVDVLLAGPPCQTFSAAGKRTLNGESKLVFNVCEFAAVVRPSIVIIENVPHFAHAMGGRLAGRVRVRLGELGFATALVSLDAADLGLPQRRKRCFLVATRDARALETWCATLVSPRGRSVILQGREPSLRLPLRRPLSVSSGIGDLPAVRAGEGIELGSLRKLPRNRLQAFLRAPNGDLYNHTAPRHSERIVRLLSDLLPGETPQRDDAHPLRPRAYYRQAYARLAPRDLAPTLTSQTHNPGSGRFTHYSHPRTLTVREVARLQGFPDEFRFFGAAEVQRRHVGNAVPPLVSAFIAGAALQSGAVPLSNSAPRDDWGAEEEQ